MNCKLTRVDTLVRFERDEPICMLVPQRRSELERFRPEWRSFDDDAPLRKAVAAFSRQRRESLLARFVADSIPGAGSPR
jgi:uncharacterized protein DUF6065